MYKKRDSSSKYSSFSNKFSSKKGQVTIFIILGILLLLTLVIVLALRKEVVTFEDKQVAPTEKGVVNNFIETCMELITDEALFMIGDQGGYINVPPEISNDASLHLRTSPFTVTPYWAYGEQTNVPSLDDIKQRLDSHIEQYLPTCLLGLGAFQERYSIVERKPVIADTKIIDRKILFRVKWDIEVRNRDGEVVTNLVDFSTESPIKLKRLHELASKIVEVEMQDLKFEDITQDLLALEHPDVPIAGTEFSCSKKRWKTSQVKETLKDMLRVNIRELRIKGTEFVKFPKELPYYENHYIWELEDEFYMNDVSTEFVFDNNFPFTFNVRPQNGAYLKSNQLGGSNILLSALCVQTWKFVYDLSFPIIVEVVDETTGFKLKYGVTVHIQRNLPDRSETPYDYKTTFISTFTDEDYCSDARVPMSVQTFSNVRNDLTGVDFSEPLDGVDIKYVCLRYSCDVGQTEYGFAGMGDISVLRTNFPYCAGAIIRGSKEGYKETWTSAPSKPDSEVVLELTPLQLFPLANIKIVKHEMGRSGTFGAAKELDNDDVVLVKMTFRHNETQAPSHEINFVQSIELGLELIKDEKVSFLGQADFIYDVEINLLEGDEITGGYKGKWYVPINKLENAQEIVLHVASKDVRSNEDLLEIYSSMEEISKMLPAHEIK